MASLFELIPFRNPQRAVPQLRNAIAPLAEEQRGQLRHMLAISPDPDRAADALERLAAGNPAAFRAIANGPQGLACLVDLFCQSQFLAEEVIRRPELMENLLASGGLYKQLVFEELADRLDLSLHFGIPDAAALASFRRREVLRIALRDIRGLATLSETTSDLSILADALLHVAYKRIRQHYASRHGEPIVEEEPGKPKLAGFSILALGKLGGQELNYSSDVDLMFVYEKGGETRSSNPISNQEFFKKVASAMTELLGSITNAGLVYRVDLRLRPDGKLGEIVISRDAAKQYYKARARDWELQMLIKARVAAGEPGPGVELLEFVEPYIYSSTLDFGAVEAVSQTRHRINERLAARKSRAGETDIKLCRGGIRDIEFLVQCLQRLHGGREPWVRHGGTLLALGRLHDKQLLSASEYSRLASAYEFLRHAEHRLQMFDDRQTHSLPTNPQELEILARRLPATTVGESAHRDTFWEALQRHLGEVTAMYERVIHAQQPVYLQEPESPEEPGDKETLSAAPGATSNLIRFLDQIAPNFAKQLAHQRLPRGAQQFEHFLERIRTAPEWIKMLDGDAKTAGRIVDVFVNSPYLAEELLRMPDLLGELAVLDAPVAQPAPQADAAELRRFFRREMFRIQCASVTLPVSVFETLAASSTLSERVIRHAYRLAVEEIITTKPPAAAGYFAADQLMVIAMGRLGMREYDLGSDADLIFVLPAKDAAEMEFWTRVAERLLYILSSYTSDGCIFSVDTRLRPNGRAGSLVQTDAACREYFDKRAEAWEGMAWMKALAVAGNEEAATGFLNDMQELDWRRYGQSGRSQAELKKMRWRLEKEHGSESPLKAGYGGFFDIDFALLFLRLKSAGFYVKQMNTPARITFIEKIGHIDRSDAAFLHDAALLYRALDHGLRLLHGHPEGSLPKSQLHKDILTELVSRWTPEHLHDQPLADELAQIQSRTREFFNRLFPG